MLDKTLHGTGSSSVRASHHLIEQFDSLEKTVSNQVPLLGCLLIVRVSLKRDSQFPCFTGLDVSVAELVRDAIRTVHGQTPRASNTPQKAKTARQAIVMMTPCTGDSAGAGV